MTTKIKAFVLFALLAPLSMQAQLLVTMSNKCLRQIQDGNRQNDQHLYQEALSTFTKVLKDCSAKDAKEEGNTGIAIAAQLAHLDFQLDMLAEADTNLTKAIELDPENPAFYIQKGDMMISAKQYDQAFLAYDKAVDLGKNDLEMYQIRTEARLKQMQQKYETTESQSENRPSSWLKTKWYGESQPKYPNDSEANREKNRRVELAIYANEDMKNDAGKGVLK